MKKSMGSEKAKTLAGEDELLVEKSATKSWKEIDRRLEQKDKKRKVTELKETSLSYLNEDREE